MDAYELKETVEGYPAQLQVMVMKVLDKQREGAHQNINAKLLFEEFALGK